MGQKLPVVCLTQACACAMPAALTRLAGRTAKGASQQQPQNETHRRLPKPNLVHAARAAASSPRGAAASGGGVMMPVFSISVVFGNS